MGRQAPGTLSRIAASPASARRGSPRPPGSSPPAAAGRGLSRRRRARRGRQRGLRPAPGRRHHHQLPGPGRPHWRPCARRDRRRPHPLRRRPRAQGLCRIGTDHPRLRQELGRPPPQGEEPTPGRRRLRLGLRFPASSRSQCPLRPSAGPKAIGTPARYATRSTGCSDASITACTRAFPTLNRWLSLHARTAVRLRHESVTAARSRANSVIGPCDHPPMSRAELVAHYQRLLDVDQRLDVAMSWTVIQPLDEPMDIMEVAELIGGPDRSSRRGTRTNLPCSSTKCARRS